LSSNSVTTNKILILFYLAPAGVLKGIWGGNVC